MAISLNDHETRIKTLENILPSSSGWDITKQSNAYCFRDKGTNLKIQFGYISGSYPTVTFPVPFTTFNSVLGLSVYDYQSTSGEGAPKVRWKNLTSARFDGGGGGHPGTTWIAIGIYYIPIVLMAVMLSWL